VQTLWDALLEILIIILESVSLKLKECSDIQTKIILSKITEVEKNISDQ
jgi:hypothetical protein